MSVEEKRPLPDGWEWKQIKDLYDVIGGGTPSRSIPEFWQGNIPWISSADIEGPNDIRPRRHVTEDAVKNSATNVVPSGSLIVVTRVGLGKVALTTEKLCFSQDSQALINNDNNVDEKYALYYLSEATKEFKHKSRGTTIAGVTKKQLKELLFPLAPLFEQQAIVAEIEKQFTRLDKAVASLKRAQANLERYKASVLKAACEGRLVPQDPDDEPAEKLLDRILAERRAHWEEQEWQKLVIKAQKKVAQVRRKADGRPARLSDLEPEEWQDLPESEYARYLPKNDKWKEKYKEPVGVETAALPSLPNGWVWSTIDQVSECLDSRRIPVNKKERESRKGAIPYYGANGQVGWIDDYIFNEPLVLVVEDETFTGRKLPFSYKISGKAWVNNHAHVLRAKATTTDYLNYSLMFYPFTPLTTGTTGRKKLTQRALRHAQYALPPIAEQKRIVAEIERKLSVIVANEKAIAANLSRAERLRQSILQQAFSGQLVPQSRGRGGSRTAPTVTNTGNSA